MINNIETLAREIYRRNCEKGLHDEPHVSIDTMLCMIVCEMCEAVEADRRNKKTKMDLYETTKADLLKQIENFAATKDIKSISRIDEFATIIMYQDIK